VSSRVLGLVVTRRTVAIAAFIGNHLDDASSIALSGKESDTQRAASFVSAAIERHEADIVALLALSRRATGQRARTMAAVTKTARRLGVPLWEAPLEMIYRVLSVPPIKSQGQMREIAGVIWPTLDDPLAGDLCTAAIIGLYVETQRYLSVLDDS
jgi:hypothetical protein